MNALAGGGTFLVFPALLFAGVPSVSANATSSLVLLPGTIASAWVYRDTMRDMTPSFLGWMAAVSLAGSLAGSFLLLHTSNLTFSMLVPWLLLGAAAVFTAAPAGTPARSCSQRQFAWMAERSMVRRSGRCMARP